MRNRTSLVMKSSTKSLKSGSSCIASPYHSLTKDLHRGNALFRRYGAPVGDLVKFVIKSTLLNGNGH
jgi:hypothetical protein